jgi:hypothetical protein
MRDVGYKVLRIKDENQTLTIDEGQQKDFSKFFFVGATYTNNPVQAQCQLLRPSRELGLTTFFYFNVRLHDH